VARCAQRWVCNYSLGAQERTSVAPPRATREHAAMRVNHLHLMVPRIPEAAGGFLVEVVT